MKRIGQTWAERINSTQKKKMERERERERENDRFFFHPPFHFPPLPMISAKLSEVEWSAEASKQKLLPIACRHLCHYFTTLPSIDPQRILLTALAGKERKRIHCVAEWQQSYCNANVQWCTGARLPGEMECIQKMNEEGKKQRQTIRFTTLIWFQFPTSKEVEKQKNSAGSLLLFYRRLIWPTSPASLLSPHHRRRGRSTFFWKLKGKKDCRHKPSFFLPFFVCQLISITNQSLALAISLSAFALFYFC